MRGFNKISTRKESKPKDKSVTYIYVYLIYMKPENLALHDEGCEEDGLSSFFALIRGFLV